MWVWNTLLQDPSTENQMETDYMIDWSDKSGPLLLPLLSPDNTCWPAGPLCSPWVPQVEEMCTW